jgi:tetratricopeptide (TPR) repeat protein
MYFEPSLRLVNGRLAYCITLPDRDPNPWPIPIDPDDVGRIAAGASRTKTCPTLIRCGEQYFDLHKFVRHLEHDWSGRVARALASFGRGELEQAMDLLHAVTADNPAGVPAAHHLLGRCYRTLERPPEAIVHYLRSVRASTDGEGNLLPYAAGPLSDMGVAFKRLGEVKKAIHCFMHSLHLRPNHPEALLTFFSLFPNDESLVIFGAARALAIGSRNDMVGHYLLNYASARERDLAVLLAMAKAMSREMDLSDWPFCSPQFGKLEAFERGLFGDKENGSPPAPDALN